MAEVRNVENIMELWEKIPRVARVKIDQAVGQGKKPEAVNRCMCSGLDINLRTAVKIIEQRKAELTKKI